MSSAKNTVESGLSASDPSASRADADALRRASHATLANSAAASRADADAPALRAHESRRHQHQSLHLHATKARQAPTPHLILVPPAPRLPVRRRPAWRRVLSRARLACHPSSAALAHLQPHNGAQTFEFHPKNGHKHIECAPQCVSM